MAKKNLAPPACEELEDAKADADKSASKEVADVCVECEVFAKKMAERLESIKDDGVVLAEEAWDGTVEVAEGAYDLAEQAAVGVYNTGNQAADWLSYQWDQANQNAKDYRERNEWTPEFSLGQAFGYEPKTNRQENWSTPGVSDFDEDSDREKNEVSFGFGEVDSGRGTALRFLPWDDVSINILSYEYEKKRGVQYTRDLTDGKNEFFGGIDYSGAFNLAEIDWAWPAGGKGVAKVGGDANFKGGVELSEDFSGVGAEAGAFVGGSAETDIIAPRFDLHLDEAYDNTIGWVLGHEAPEFLDKSLVLDLNGEAAYGVGAEGVLQAGVIEGDIGARAKVKLVGGLGGGLDFSIKLSGNEEKDE